MRSPEGSEHRLHCVYREIVAPERLVYTWAWLDEDGSVSFDYRPVHAQTLTDEVEAIPPKARVY